MEQLLVVPLVEVVVEQEQPVGQVRAELGPPVGQVQAELGPPAGVPVVLVALVALVRRVPQERVAQERVAC